MPNYTKVHGRVAQIRKRGSLHRGPLRTQERSPTLGLSVGRARRKHRGGLRPERKETSNQAEHAPAHRREVVRKKAERPKMRRAVSVGVRAPIIVQPIHAFWKLVATKSVRQEPIIRARGDPALFADTISGLHACIRYGAVSGGYTD